MECNSLLDLRRFYEPIATPAKYDDNVANQWVFFMQWYRSKLQLSSVSHRILAERYTITFYPRGDAIEATLSSTGSVPFVIGYDKTEKAYEIFRPYNELDPIEETHRLKAWVLQRDTIVSDFGSFEYTDVEPNMWALFLQYFVGAALDMSTGTRAIQPMERFATTGIIYGSGYELWMDDANVVHVNEREFAIYGEQGFDVLDALKRHVRGLEMRE